MGVTMAGSAEDGAALFAAFTDLANHLRMHPDERCDLLGVSVETWRALARGTAQPAILQSERAIRRLRYAVGLMRRSLAGEPPAAALTPPPPAEPPGR